MCCASPARLLPPSAFLLLPLPSLLSRCTCTFSWHVCRPAALWVRIADGRASSSRVPLSDERWRADPFPRPLVPRPPVRRPANDAVLLDLRAVGSCMSSWGYEHGVDGVRMAV
ncbi:hypothetical protein SCHPADRAFT_722988 [Schizopora paradoxa]|uniref:Secreted protein n=1 Tax=Schizopora paradoxa TaxID=27342 RepID=A0A0H2R1C2_9AGAM|nr:hypothetical protein SCHPADRAFT_722988 [Schizopora paradoxa]